MPRTPITTSYTPRTEPTTSYNLERTIVYLLKNDGKYLLLQGGGKIILNQSFSNIANYNTRPIVITPY